MSTDTKTSEELETFKEKQSEIRTKLKELVKEQVEVKSVLRAPHTKYVGDEMYFAQFNSARITHLLSQLNELYGKPNSHEYKRKEA